MRLPDQMRHVTYRLTHSLHLPQPDHIVAPEFSRSRRHYLAQAGLATVAMLAVLLLTDSLSDAALAAGLASSVIILFMHPSSRAATPRALVGGHMLALGVGSGLSLLFFSTDGVSVLEHITLVEKGMPIIEGVGLLRVLPLAASVGILIVMMAVTDTEHPPAAGTVLGVASRAWDLHTTAVIIGAIVLLVCIKVVLHRYLRDLV